MRANLAALDAVVDANTDDGLARAARARGGSLVAEGLEIEARFRNAVSAALDHAASGFAWSTTPHRCSLPSAVARS